MTVKSTHVCFRDKEITDMHRILTGNGEPEKGLCRQVALIGERQSKIKETLDDIKKSLSSATAIEKEIEIQTRVRNEMDGIKNIRFTKKSAIIGLILYALMLVSTFFFSMRSSKHGVETKEIVTDTKTEVDMINVPMRTRGGKTYLMPAGMLVDSIKGEQNDF